MNARDTARRKQGMAGGRDAHGRVSAGDMGYVSRRQGAEQHRRDERGYVASGAGRAVRPAAYANERRAGARGAKPRSAGNASKAGSAARDVRQARAQHGARRQPPVRPRGSAEHAQRKARGRSRSSRIWREVGTWALTLALAALVGLGVRGFVFELVRVEGPSMSPTLAGDEVLLVTRYDYLASDPERGDVVLCRYPNREGTFIKRVIALPGDSFEIRAGCTYVNDEPIDESYVEFAATEDYGPVLIGDGQYMLLGDNRAVSHDSRASDVGTLQADDIVGRVRYVVYPFDDMRSLVS